MHCTTKYMLIMLISLYSVAFAASSSSQASSSSSAPISAQIYNDASSLFTVVGNGRFATKSHVTDEYMVISVAHTVYEEHSREGLEAAVGSSLESAVKNWRDVETFWSANGRFGKKCFREDAPETQASLMLSLILNQNNMRISTKKDVKHSVDTNSKTHVLTRDLHVLWVQYSNGECSFDGYSPASSFEECSAHLKSSLASKDEAEDSLMVMIDYRKLLTMLKRSSKDKKTEECTIS